MELFTKLFGGLLLFVYHCFDRIVINGYLSGLSRPEQVVHFFRHYPAFGTISGKLEVSAPNPLLMGLGVASVSRSTRHSQSNA